MCQTLPQDCTGARLVTSAVILTASIQWGDEGGIAESLNCGFSGARS